MQILWINIIMDGPPGFFKINFIFIFDTLSLELEIFYFNFDNFFGINLFKLSSKPWC